MSTYRDGCQCRGGDLDVSCAGCQVMAADSLSSRHGESGEGGGARKASLEAIFKLNFF